MTETHTRKRPSFNSPKIVMSVIIVGLITTYVTSSRVFSLIIVPSITTYLMIGQIRAGIRMQTFCCQVFFIYLFHPMSLYFSTGFYFGNSDILNHVGRLELLLSSGNISSIPEGYNIFPGLHIISATFSLVNNLPAYDSLIIIGSITFSMLTVIVTLFSSIVTHDRRIGMLTGLVMSMLPVSLFYSSYFTAQSFTFVMYVFLLYILYKKINLQKSDQRLMIIFFIIGSAAIFSHHLTHLLVLGTISVILIYYLARSMVLPKTGILAGLSIFLFPTVGSIYYWKYQETFIHHIIMFVYMEGRSILSTGGATPVAPDGPSIISFGEVIPELSPMTAASSLLSFDAVHYILLIGILTFTLSRLSNIKSLNSITEPFLLLGLIGFSFSLLPISLFIPPRVPMVFMVFMSIAIAIGINEMGVISLKNKQKYALVTLVLVVFSVTGGVTSANDVYALHSGPNLEERIPVEEPQVEFSEQEISQLEYTAKFSKQYQITYSSTWITRAAMERYNVYAAKVSLSKDGLDPATDYLVYRERWTDHSVLHFGDQLIRIRFSEQGMESFKQQRHKIYTTSETGVLMD